MRIMQAYTKFQNANCFTYKISSTSTTTGLIRVVNKNNVEIVLYYKQWIKFYIN